MQPSGEKIFHEPKLCVAYPSVLYIQPTHLIITQGILFPLGLNLFIYAFVFLLIEIDYNWFQLYYQEQNIF